MTTSPLGTIRSVKIEEEMRSSYLDYAMSVIVARALPDVRDGLKPVQRRVLYAMLELGLRPTAAYKKSARIVGEVLGKYHPHGDAPVYDAMVRMAQDFTMRYPLISGQGNFGSIDNDPPAAMRYTEARLARIAEEMLANIEQETVDWVPNFDDSLREPTVLPALLPNLLVNGSSGIAVGMATSIPPHNLAEVCDGIIHLIDDPNASVEELMAFIQGPDFPTAAIARGVEGIVKAYTTGQGKVVLQARAEVETQRGNRNQIIVSEIPYQVNKAALVERIAELARDRKIEGISDIRDESDRHGLRIVIELKRDAQPSIVLNNLYKHTALQSAFYINMLALVDGVPRVLNLKSALQHYISFRREIIVRRSEFDLRKARERAHILEGLIIALDRLDEVIATIRSSPSADEARTALMQRFSLTQVQAQAILDMQLRRLAALERQKILDEYAELKQTIAELEALLADPQKVLATVRQETQELKDKYGDDRRTVIDPREVGEQTKEELIQSQDVIITLSSRGYIKSALPSTYRIQHRGGKGVLGMSTRDSEIAEHLLVANTHDTILFFTNTGRATPLKCYELPFDVSRTSRGAPLITYVPLEEHEKVTAILPVSGFREDRYLIFATLRGTVKKTPLSAFANIRSKGIIAMKLQKNDELVAASLAQDKDEVILVSEQGQSVRFSVDVLREASRTSGGVRGMRLAPSDHLVSIDVVIPDGEVLAISRNGFGKLTRVANYSLRGRGGKGVRAMRVTPKTGPVVAARVISADRELILASAKGKITRVSLEEVPIKGRNTQGVIVMVLDSGDQVVAVACLGAASTPDAKTEGDQDKKTTGHRASSHGKEISQ